ncbi:MAG: hypothetical protein LIP28_04610 [Deltaproteobacteria bacterium]|nr:hypothetical protein [Deltaproteobacteria bacterium]
MSQINIPVTQLAQLGYADRIAHEAQGQPEIARQTAQQAAPEALKQQKDAIAEPEKTAKNRALKSEKDGHGGGASGDTPRRRGEPPPEEQPDSSPDTPWAGNIVNLKV